MNEARKAGRLYGVGLGPGDPELVTLKALRVVKQAQVIAYPSRPARSKQCSVNRPVGVSE